MAGAIPTVPLPGGESESLRVPYDQRRISPDEFGAGIGEGIQRLGQGLERVQADADAMAAQEAETRYAKEILEKVHGTTDPDTGEVKPGFASLKGHQALEAASGLSRELEQRRDQIAGEFLKNDRQRRLFLGRTQGDLLGAERTIQAHLDEQWASLRREGLKTRLETATQSAAASVVTGAGAVDLPGAHAQIDAMRPWLEIAAEEQGLKGDDAERFVHDGQAGVAVAVLERLLEDQADGSRGHGAAAKAFLEENRAILDPKIARQYAARVGPADIRDRAIAEADRIWREAEGDPRAVIMAARGIGEGALRDEVEKRLEERLRDDHQVRVAADSPREARLEIGIYQGKGLDRGAQDYLALSDEGRARVEAKARSENRADTAEQRRLDDELWWRYRALALGGKPGQDQVSLDVDHSAVLAGASRRLRDRVKADQQDRARPEWSKDTGVARNAFLDQARAVADSLGWLGSEAAGAPSKRAKFLRAMETAYDTWGRANPQAKAMPEEQARKVFVDSLRKGDLGTAWGLSPNRYAWELRSEDRPAFTTEGIAQPGLAAVERVLGPALGAPTRPEAPPVPGAVKTKSGRWAVKNAAGQWEYL